MSEKSTVSVESGIGMGTALAMILSWHTHQSILWAIINGLFSWLYVIYWYFTHS